LKSFYKQEEEEKSQKERNVFKRTAWCMT